MRENICAFSDEDEVWLAYGTVAFNATDFTITWTENTNTTATLINWIIWGGADITGIDVGTIVAANSGTYPEDKSFTTSAATQNITNGEGILFLASVLFSTDSPVTGIHGIMMFGAATSPSQECAVGFGTVGGGATSNVSTAYDDDACWNVPFAVNTYLVANLKTFDAAGFDLTFTVNIGDSTRHAIYLIMKGGRWEVGEGAHATSTGTKAFTTAFEPKALITMSSRLTSSTRLDGDGDFCLGITDGTEEYITSHGEENGLSTSDLVRRTDNDEVVAIHNPAAASVDGEAAFSSFNATDFTLDYGNGFASANLFGWIVCADDALTVVTEDHTTDSLLKKFDLTRTHTTDSLLKKIDNLLTHTTDSFLQSTVQPTVEHTTDSLLQTVDNTRTHSTDSFLIQYVLVTHIEFEIPLGPITVVHTTDSLLKAIDNLLTHTTDSLLQTVDNLLTHTTDSLLKAIDTLKTHTTDSFLTSQVVLTHTTDSLLQSHETTNHTTDSLLAGAGTRTHTTDSLLQEVDNLRTHTTDSFLSSRRLLIHTTDSLLQSIDNLRTHTTDSLLKAIDTLKTHTSDSLLKKLDNLLTHTTDSLKKRIDSLLTHTTDSFILTSGTRIHTTDSFLANPGRGVRNTVIFKRENRVTVQLIKERRSTQRFK